MPYGYVVSEGYMGRIGNRFYLFPTESDYLEALKEQFEN